MAARASGRTLRSDSWSQQMYGCSAAQGTNVFRVRRPESGLPVSKYKSPASFRKASRNKRSVRAYRTISATCDMRALYHVPESVRMFCLERHRMGTAISNQAPAALRDPAEPAAVGQDLRRLDP